MPVLVRKMLRTIWRSRGQAMAAIAVVMCGTACYICMASLYRNLLLTRDTYYSHYRFADFEIMLERAPNTSLFRLEEIPGVRQVRGRITQDVNVDLPDVDVPRTGRIVSMPDTPQPVLNDIVVRQGSYFEQGAQNETIISERFAEANNIAVGDSVHITLDGKRHSLKVVGLGLSPEYVYVIRNIQELVPSPDRFGIFWVPEDFAETALSMQGACNNIVGSVDDPERLDAILERAEELLDSYGVFAKVKQEDQISNRFISDEIIGLRVNARIVPTIFLGIAGLVIFILLNRMVRNERTQVGLLKAYGYSNWAVGFHYLQFALFLSIVGCFLGFFMGQWMATGLMGVYVEFYQFPLLRNRVYPEVLARSMGIAIAFSLAGAIVAARRASQIHPAESMRPEAPRIGKRTWLENVPFLWQRMSFTWKMISRNVSRSTFRAALNALGVMISSGLIIVGFFSLDGINYIMHFQYELTQREDVKVSFHTERGKEALYDMSRLDYVREAEPLLQYPFEMRNGWRKKDVVVFGLPRHADLQKLINAEEEEVDIGTEGLILSEKLAEILGVNPGDELELEPLMGRVTKTKRVRVASIVEQFFGMSGWMNLDALSRVLDEPFVMNAALLRTDPGKESALNEVLRDTPVVAAVEIKSESVKSLEDTLAQSMWIMSASVLLFAGVIAFSVIYNVTTVSLSERQRELASLRVLGFTRHEVGRILFHENFLTGAIGLMIGTPFGMFLCWMLVSAYDTELYRFPFIVTARTIAIANITTILFIVVANLAVRRKIHQLDLVEVLKERE